MARSPKEILGRGLGLGLGYKDSLSDQHGTKTEPKGNGEGTKRVPRGNQDGCKENRACSQTGVSDRQTDVPKKPEQADRLR